MLLARVVETSARVAETSKRLEKIELLATLAKQLDEEESEIAVAFLCGYTRQGRIGVGGATLRESAAPAVETAGLEIRDVDRVFADLAKVTGRGAEAQRCAILRGLLGRATAAEQRFLTALLFGEIRQGALEGVMVEALARASGARADEVRRAVMLAGDIARVARSVLQEGPAGLAPYTIQLLRPVQPMLAQTAGDVEGALEDLGEASLEFKFDGARVQVHRLGDEVAIFSRALNNLTKAAPEIVEAVRALPGGDLILDGEIISLTPNGRPQPFQVTARRFGRKLDLERMRSELPLTPYWFDLLYLDGQPLIDEPQSRRFAALASLAPPGSLVPRVVTADPREGAEFLGFALDSGNEGIMAKAIGAPYAAGAEARAG